MEKLIISKSVKDFKSYDNPKNLTQVQAAEKLMAMGYEFVPGMKVSYVVTNSKKTPQEVEPYVSGTKFTATPDYKYYAERLAQTVARATENFGWTEKDLLLGSQQVSLFSDTFNGSSPKEAKEEKPQKKDGVRKTEKKRCLDDFLG